MPAPKGNQYALGNKGGRPTKYQERYCEDIIEFFDRERFHKVLIKKGVKEKGTKDEYKFMPNELPTLRKFAKKIGVDPVTLLAWAKNHKEFSRALSEAKEIYKEFLIENGLLGLYNSVFTIFVAKNTTDMKDKQEVEHSSDGKPFIIANLSQDEVNAKLKEKFL